MLIDYHLQVWAIELIGHPNLSKAIAKRWRQLLFAKVTARVHSCHDAEVFVSDKLLDTALAPLSENKEPAWLEHTVQPLQHGIVCKRDLVNDKQMAATHGCHQRTIGPGE